ncbi:MAG: RuBisCO large subunit C-terminal-like domain-containing protein [Actinobacteria bacterium]|nr:RuBisCO large subunit C-terminal-like domain-containing protein [Actinomycetota bacterium]
MLNPMYDPVVFNNEIESLDSGKYFIVTFYFENEREPGEFIDHLAMIQRAGLLGSTGAWVKLEDETDDVRERLCFKIVGYYQLPSVENVKKAVVQIAYPIEAYNSDNLNIPTLLMAPVGNILMYPGKCLVLGISFPKLLVEQFKGPKFGINGIRNLVNVQDRPLLMVVSKPKIGMSPKETAQQVYECAIAGADLFKDDEGMTETWNSRFDERLNTVVEALHKAESKTGKKTLYFITVTDEVDRVMGKAARAMKRGATGFLLCCSTGWSQLRVMAESHEIDVPILYHLTTCSVYLERMSFTVFNKISRLCGADILIIPPFWGTLPITTLEDELRSVQVLKSKFFQIKPSFPMVGGGVYLGMVPSIWNQYGIDVIFEAGGGIFGHPSGMQAGCEAFHQAFNAMKEGKSLEQASKEKENTYLLEALQKWGELDRPTMPNDGLFNKWGSKRL